MQPGGCCTAKQAKQIAKQLIEAIVYLNEKGIAHLDVKPDNIMVTETKTSDLTVKLIDFNVSQLLFDAEREQLPVQQIFTRTTLLGH